MTIKYRIEPTAGSHRTTSGAKRFLASLLLGSSTLALSAFAQAQTVVLDESFTSGLGQFTAASSSSVTTGTFGARMNGTFGGTDGQITSAPLSTTGLTNITLSFTRTTVGLDSGEMGVASYSVNGTTYTTVESLQSASGAISFNLGTAAENQSQLRLRFSVSASTSSETYTVDNVRLVGTGGGGGCEPNCPPPTNPFAKGPDPTTTSLQATAGPFTTASVTVSASSTPGFGAGTIYYPNNTPGSFAAIAVVPGYLATQSSVNWWGPRIASHGFVVIVFDTNSTSDQPASRATQLMAALQHVVTLGNTSSHAIYQKVDGNRLGVMGWSMGGGGSLIAARDNPTLKAAIPFAPYNSSTSFSGITVPTLIIACESDGTAPVGSHASPFYNSIPASTDKAYLEINGGSHSCAGSSASATNKAMLGKYGVAWVKRFMDNDVRYSPFLCGAPHQTDLGNTAVISEYRETCPY